MEIAFVRPTSFAGMFSNWCVPPTPGCGLFSSEVLPAVMARGSLGCKMHPGYVGRWFGVKVKLIAKQSRCNKIGSNITVD